VSGRRDFDEQSGEPDSSPMPRCTEALASLRMHISRKLYIQKGQVKLTIVSEHGKEAVVALSGPDEFFGEGCLAGQSRRMATATAMIECEIMRLEKQAMIRVLQEPAFSEMFVSHLLERTVEADLVDQLFNSSEKRLA
jgi:CRP/FNR family transcriptional regulator, cyclic AMP receptor protein